jgi:hypothetical protein
MMLNPTALFGVFIVKIWNHTVLVSLFIEFNKSKVNISSSWAKTLNLSKTLLFIQIHSFMKSNWYNPTSFIAKTLNKGKIENSFSLMSASTNTHS